MLDHTPDFFVLSYVPHTEVRIAYDVRQWPPQTRRRGAREKTYFYQFGEALWVIPDWDDNTPVSITLLWRGIPRGGSLCNSYGAGRHRQHILDTLAHFRHGSYLGGDFRIRRFVLKGQTLTVARRGRWNFPDSAFDAALRHLYTVQSDLWSNTRFLYTLVVLFPTDAPSGNFGGEGRTRCFDLFLPQGDTLSWGILHLLSHELFHSWNPEQLRWDGKQAYWFTEGFTDYFAARTLLRAGLASPTDFLNYINHILRQYYLSPSRNRSYAQLMHERDNSLDADRMLYQRGCLLALDWDAAIRAATRDQYSLAEVMRALLLAAHDPKFSLSSDSIALLASKYLGPRAQDDVRRYIETGETLAPHTDALQKGTILRTVMLPTFDLGFDAGSFTARRITGVRLDSNAYRAGVRDGQTILAGGFQPGNTEAPVHLRVADTERGKAITYYPRGTTMQVPQYQTR